MKQIGQGAPPTARYPRAALTDGAARRLGLAGVATAAVLVVAACGSDTPAESVASSPATPLSAPSSPATSSTTIESQPVEAPATTQEPSESTALDTDTVEAGTVEAGTAETDTVETGAAETTTLESTTADAAAESSPAEPSEVECRRLTDFDDGDGWLIVNDGVMGGRSNGAVEFFNSAMRFTGDVVTAGGGFTSVRFQLTGDELEGSDHLALRVRTDDRIYGLTLQDAAQARGRFVSHGADLVVDGPTDADGWQTTELRYDELFPSVFGQSVDAPPFEPDGATEIGIIIGDGVDGPFTLDIDWIDACNTPPAQ